MPMEHTPGPWRVDRPDRAEDNYDVLAGENALITTTAGWYGEVDYSLPNAHLIASSPDLLLAAKEALEYFASDQFEDPREAELASILREAIAKAETPQTP